MSRMRVALSLLIGLPTPAAPALAQAEWSCYALTYPGEDPADVTHYPSLLALGAGGASGVVVSRASGADSIGFWNMFRNPEAQWSALGRDSVKVEFTNGFTWVELSLARADSSFTGRAVIHFDFGDPNEHPRFTIRAQPTACREEYLAGPERDPVAVAGRQRRLRRASHEANETKRVAELQSPLAGTYVFELRLAAGHLLTLYGRTGANPSTPLWSLHDHWHRGPPEDVDTAAASAYQIPIAVARTMRDLPTVFDLADGKTATLAYFALGERPIAVAADSTVWDGYTDILFAALRLINDQPLDSLLLAASEDLSAVWYDREPGATLGMFVVHADGTSAVLLQVERAGSTVLSIRGRRLSRESVQIR